MKFIKNRDRFVESNGSEIHIPKVIWDIHIVFAEFGFKLYLVGGSIRDFLSGQTPKDYDVATNAKPEDVIKLFTDKFGVRKKNGSDFVLRNGWRINLQGESFGVVVIYIPGEKEGVEIASFNTRHDGKIILDATIEDDANRRDITFNSLFYDLDKKEIIDLVGGVEDLKNKRLRMVGDPSQRIMEDPLRIQRLFRFGPRYGADMDDKTKDAINNLKHLYREPSDERPNGVSQERIVEEFMKSFKTLPKFQKYIDYLDEFGMWKILFPGISFNKSPRFLETDSIEVALAQLLVNERNDVFNSLMVREWKFPSILSKTVKLLVDITRLDTEGDSAIDDAINIRMNQLRNNIGDGLIRKFISLVVINNPLVDKLLKFNPTDINSVDVMDELGMEHDNNGRLLNPKKDGAKLGQELSRRKVELFKSL